MNENFRKLYKESNYSAIGFSQIIGVSRQRFYSIINNKQVLRETTYYKIMKTIEEIKNEKSRDLGNENFKELFENAVKNLPIEKAFLKINCIINEASLNYAKEVAIASLEKASNNLRQAYGSFNSDFYSQKMSITNEENIVL